jgi:FAD/FMN-containing dehydrogenase
LLQLRVLGATRTPFAVKGGGHATNPGFSSTLGVQIAMVRFNTVTIDHAASTVSAGAGLLWDDVYKALDGTGLNVVGGRAPGVGIAGLALGGGGYLFIIPSCPYLCLTHPPTTGYSWKTSQFGLAIDNIESYELVLSNGTVRVVTHQDDDLYFGLRVCVIVFRGFRHLLNADLGWLQ